MARKRKTVKTFHLLEIIESLQKQNESVGMLLAVVESILRSNPDMIGKDDLRIAADSCRADVYPPEE